jgi:hypothetical protein
VSVSLSAFVGIVAFLATLDALVTAHGTIRTFCLLAAVLFLLVGLGTLAARPDPRRRLTLTISVALMTVALIGVAILRPHHKADSLTSPRLRNTTAGEPTSSPSFGSLLPKAAPLDPYLYALGSKDLETRRNAVSSLSRLTHDPHTSDEDRRSVLLGLASMIRHFGPANPLAPTTRDYCFEEPALHYPADVDLALKTLGHRLDKDIGAVPIDLTGANLAYASIRGLDYAGVQFDNALMCRMFLSTSNFKGATFVGANLRYSYLLDATGISVMQLSAASSLCKIHLTHQLSASAEWLNLLATDAENPRGC